MCVCVYVFIRWWPLNFLSLSLGSKSIPGVGVGSDRGTTHSTQQQRPANVDGERITCNL